MIGKYQIPRFLNSVNYYNLPRHDKKIILIAGSILQIEPAKIIVFEFFMTQKTIVSVVRCESYNRDKVITAINQTFDFFGGIQNIIKKGTQVLLKPNFIKESAPE